MGYIQIILVVIEIIQLLRDHQYKYDQMNELKGLEGHNNKSHLVQIHMYSLIRKFYI